MAIWTLISLLGFFFTVEMNVRSDAQEIDHYRDHVPCDHRPLNQTTSSRQPLSKIRPGRSKANIAMSGLDHGNLLNKFHVHHQSETPVQLHEQGSLFGRQNLTENREVFEP